MSGAACIIIISNSGISTLDASYELEGKLRALYNHPMILGDLVNIVPTETITNIQNILGHAQLNETDQEFLKETLLTF